MEDVKIQAFLRAGPDSGIGYGPGSGIGYGTGTGTGYGDGSSHGSGDGTGTGYGDGAGIGYGSGDSTGTGHGSGYGSGDGDVDGTGYGTGCGGGTGAINGEKVYMIDGIPTILRQIHGNIANGAILDSSLTLIPCHVAKGGEAFAHGDTVRDAVVALQDKLFNGMTEEKRIEAFVKAHQWGREYANEDLYDWHHKLTGSCEAGRKAFARDHNVDMGSSMTVEAFITLTEDAYGGSIIRNLRAAYEKES